MAKEIQETITKWISNDGNSYEDIYEAFKADILDLFAETEIEETDEGISLDDVAETMVDQLNEFAELFQSMVETDKA